MRRKGKRFRAEARVPMVLPTLLAVPDDSESHGAAVEAAEFLKSFLADGPVAATEVRRTAKSAGLSGRTLDRAKKLVGVRARREGFGKGSTWMWELGSKYAKSEDEA